MADQRPWFKLWNSALSDSDLEALSLEDWARWARLGAYVKMHGEAGSIRLPFDGQSLRSVLRVSPQLGSSRGWESLISTLRVLPGVEVQLAGDGKGQVATVSFRNWKKYQDDTSRERMRALRDRHRRGDGDERHTVTPPTVTSSSESDGVEERRGRRESPYPLTGTSITANRFDLPPEAFHPDCPDPRWRGHCVNAAWLADHPTVTNYPAMDAQGTPKRCPAHRA